MAKFDVCEFGPDGSLVLDIQSDLLSDLNTRVVVPLISIEIAPKLARYLNPIFDIGDEQYVMMTQYLSAVPTLQLGKFVGNLSGQFSEITRAIDMVFQGF